MVPKFGRRKFLALTSQAGLGTGLSLAFASCASLDSSSASHSVAVVPLQVLRMAHQPLGTFLFLRHQGTLEKRLAPMGITVEWTEFQAGLPILEAMGEGAIDIGTGGVVPPVMAQSRGLPFVYVANETPVPESIGIIVPEGSSIKTLWDLRRRRIAVTKGSAGYYLLVRALIKAQLKLEDVQVVDLPPPKGKEAFETGQVDALVIWHPYLAQLKQIMPIRFLTNADGLMNDRNFYFATQAFANQYPDVLRTVMQEARQVGAWAMSNPADAAKILADYSGLAPELAVMVSQIRRYDVLPLQDRAIEEQQRIAETFFRLNLLPQRIWVEDAVWQQELSS